MNSWAFFNANNGNELNRGRQGGESEAHKLAQRYADTGGYPVEYISEGALHSVDRLQDDEPVHGKVVEPTPEPKPEPAHIKWLLEYGACKEGIAFASKYPTLQAAWDACDNIEYLAWVALSGVEAKLGVRIGIVNKPEYVARFMPIHKARDVAEAEADETGEDPCDLFRAEIKCPVIEGE